MHRGKQARCCPRGESTCRELSSILSGSLADWPLVGLDMIDSTVDIRAVRTSQIWHTLVMELVCETANAKSTSPGVAVLTGTSGATGL